MNGSKDVLGFHPGSAFQLSAECNGAAALLPDSSNKRLFLACAQAIEELRTEIKQLRCSKP